MSGTGNSDRMYLGIEVDVDILEGNEDSPSVG